MLDMEMEIKHGISSISHRNGVIQYFVIMSLLIIRNVSGIRYSGNETDRHALLQFKNQIYEDPNGVLHSWNDTLHHCHWQGITCNARHRRVVAITLTGTNMFGSVSPYLGNLSFLNSIFLGDNRFHGEIPQAIGRLFRLTALNLSWNTLTGSIPVNLSSCSELKVIDFTANRLQGKIPFELSTLMKLLLLRLSKNNLTGEVPSFLGNLTSLEHLFLPYNNLVGRLPMEIGLLGNLCTLAVGTNKLTGIIPTSIFNSSSIVVFSVPQNSFSGELPFGMLKQLEVGYLTENEFTGIIPPSITNSSRLKVLQVGFNKLVGQVPIISPGDLLNLRDFNIRMNFLGNNSSGDLKFITSLSNCSGLNILSISDNFFGGELPNSIANFSLQLTVLHMGVNKIRGKIPDGLGKYQNLYRLGMERNLFSGPMPCDFGNIQKIQLMILSGNRLSGKFPCNILCNLTSLYWLNLKANAFEGEIIECQCFGNFQRLRFVDISQNNLGGSIPPLIFTLKFSPLLLDFSHNSFIGSVPEQIGKLSEIFVLNLSYNKFSGKIPETLHFCSSLTVLALQGNYFYGSIPPVLASLKGMEHLDLSQNNLTGKIPHGLERLALLNYLNLSCNDLEGEVPIHGVFNNSSLIMLEGNGKLCGGVTDLRLHSCIRHNKDSVAVIMTASVVFGAILVFAALLICFIIYFNKGQKRSEMVGKSFKLSKIHKISYHELHIATQRFSLENLIGTGSFGSVYRGRLDQYYPNKVVAIKVLNLHKNGASRSIKAEFKALRNIRHRNIVPILTCCSSIDFKGHEFKAIVYEYMENGCLNWWLHPESDEQSRNLNFLQRLKIAIDVASAVQYLHDHCGIVTVHCDLKPSNILLDNDLNARVSDFGLARVLHRETLTNYSEQETSNSIAIKGSIGYVAPEYGIGGEASTEGDVYSFGILLLEMFSCRRPTDDIFIGGLNLHNYIEMNLQENNVKKTVDPSLLSEELQDLEKFLHLLFRIGLKCSASSPNHRIDMSEVLRELKSIKRCLSLR